MKKNPVKTFFKSACLTLGILCLLYSLLNPAVYLFGKSTEAVFDNVDFNPRSEGALYDCEVTFHYFASGARYDGFYSFPSPYDESFSYDTHTVRYIPFIPSYGIIDLGYKIPVASYALCGLGIVFIVVGIVIRPTKKAAPSAEPAPKSFICPACRKEIDSDSIYCNHCGRKIIS